MHSSVTLKPQGRSATIDFATCRGDPANIDPGYELNVAVSIVTDKIVKSQGFGAVVGEIYHSLVNLRGYWTIRVMIGCIIHERLLWILSFLFVGAHRKRFVCCLI